MHYSRCALWARATAAATGTWAAAAATATAVAVGVQRVGQTPLAILDARAVHLPRPNRGTWGQSAEGAKAKKSSKREGWGRRHTFFVALQAPIRQPEGGRRKEPLHEAIGHHRAAVRLLHGSIGYPPHSAQHPDWQLDVDVVLGEPAELLVVEVEVETDLSIANEAASSTRMHHCGQLSHPVKCGKL